MPHSVTDAWTLDVKLYAVGFSRAGTAWWCRTLHRARPSWSWRRATSCSCTRSVRTAGSKARSRGTAGRASFPAASSTASDSNTCRQNYTEMLPSLERCQEWQTEGMNDDQQCVYTGTDLSTNQAFSWLLQFFTETKKSTFLIFTKHMYKTDSTRHSAQLTWSSSCDDTLIYLAVFPHHFIVYKQTELIYEWAEQSWKNMNWIYYTLLNKEKKDIIILVVGDWWMI